MSAWDRSRASYGESRGGRGKRRKLTLFLFGILVFVAAAVAPVAFYGWKDLYLNFVEKVPPVIKIANPPFGAGIEPAELVIDLKDEHSGLELLIIRGRQGDESRELKRTSFVEKDGQRKHKARVKLTIDPRELSLREGDFEVTVTVFDRSFWSNRQTKHVSMKIDYKRPEIEVLTFQHNAVRGGAQLVIYRVYEANLAFSGVRVGSELYPGFPAQDFDPAFSAWPEVQFALFPIPVDFDSKQDRVSLFARDAVGNFATARINFTVRPVRQRESKFNLSRKFLEDRAVSLYQSYLSRYGGSSILKGDPPYTDSELIQVFRVVNERYRQESEKALRTLFSSPKATWYWKGRFFRAAGSRMADFGDYRTYVYGAEEIGSSLHTGVDIASTMAADVRAANNGVVIFADNLGLYGQTIIVDHGFGLSSLYAHLSSKAVREGDHVRSAQIIGKSGDSGFAAGPHLHFEIRLHGEPVRPIEWWDGRWVEEHIEQRIAAVKSQLQRDAALFEETRVR